MRATKAVTATNSQSLTYFSFTAHVRFYDSLYSRNWSKCVCRPSGPGTEHTKRAFWNVLHLLTKLLWPPMSFCKQKHRKTFDVQTQNMACDKLFRQTLPHCQDFPNTLTEGMLQAAQSQTEMQLLKSKSWYLTEHWKTVLAQCVSLFPCLFGAFLGGTPRVSGAVMAKRKSVMMAIKLKMEVINTWWKRGKHTGCSLQCGSVGNNLISIIKVQKKMQRNYPPCLRLCSSHKVEK